MTRSTLKNICRLIQEANEELPVEQSFLSDLKRSIELTDKANRRLPSKTYKPSSMHCIRNMYYQRIGAPQDDGESSYTLVGICNSGTDIHQRIQQSVLDMKSNDMDCEYVNVAEYVRSRELDDLEIVKEPDFEHGDYETKLFHKKLNISFLCDGIIRYKGKYYILELKTESSNKWMMRKGVDPKHYMQGTAYSSMFEIHGVIFVYINRDVLDMKAYMFEPTDDMKSELMGKITNCDNYIEHNVVPPKPEDLPRSVCEFCNYKTMCRGDL
jgi:CRISPR/Cas system-associated exonuclease Cas4 (RecB family)